MHQQKEFLGHPVGLYILFLTELWERFSFYGMRAILVLYMVSKSNAANPGLGWSDSVALDVYGWYAMAAYLSSIPGGLLADRFLGQKKAVMLGGLMLCVGHGILAINSLTAFFAGLALIVLGVGALKPNISTMVGGLYARHDIRRDAGFTIFYIGINLGAFLASLIVGYVGEVISWHYGFALAGFGMLVGQGVYWWGQKYLQGVGDVATLPTANAAARHKALPLTRVEKDRMIVLLLACLIVIVFWAAYEQGGGLLNIYAKEKIDRWAFGYELPASVFQALNPLFIMLCGTVVAGYWSLRKSRHKEASSLFKMAIGTMIMGAGFLMMSGAALEARHAANGQAAMVWLVGAYFLHTIGELSCSPVSLSFITKMAPTKYASLMMGVYFAAMGLGNKLAGLVGAAAANAGELQIFVGIFIFCQIFGLLLLAFLRQLKALTHHADDGPPEEGGKTKAASLAETQQGLASRSVVQPADLN